MVFNFLKKNMPRGIGNLQLDKTLKYYKDNYDSKVYAHYKIELNLEKNNINYVLRTPINNDNPFRIVLVVFPSVEDMRWIDDLVSYQICLLYRNEVKKNIGENNIFHLAIKKYGTGFKIIDDKSEGFYKIYRWRDAMTEIELAFGYQFDRLKFSDMKKMLSFEKKEISVITETNTQFGEIL